VSIRLLAFVVVALAVLAGLFWLFKPGATPAPAQPAPSQQVQPVTAALEIRQGHLAAGPAVIRAVQGQKVRIQLTSDRDAELHLHGYDLHVHLRAGTPAELAFIAVHSGRFDLEMHGSGHGAHQALSVVEVAPR